MKKHLLHFWTLALLVMFGGSAWAGDKTVVKYSFDDAMSPSLTAGSRVSFDYDKTSVITSTTFLNAWNNANGDPGASTVSLGSTDLSGETWTLSFEWAACGGCNSKADHTTLQAGNTNLFDLTGNSNWNTTVTITYNGSDGTKTLPVPGCDKGKRFTAGTGDQLNTTAYWHHIVVTGSASGVTMTITNSSTGTAVVENVVLSETNVNPTSLIIEPCCGGAIGIDELSLTYFVEGEVIQTPTANYTAVNGIERTITATCDTEGATLYYSTDSENWTEGASITVSASSNVYFKAVKGNSESDVLTFAAVAEAITLNAPTIVRSDNTTVTISADQTDLLLSPTATIKYTYGNEAGEFTGSKTLTVAAEATITAYAEATGYTTSATSERAVALFPEYVNSGLNTPTKTSGTSSFALSTETITVSEREYAALLLDDVQWGTNVYLQKLTITDPIVWGIRNGNWYINTTDPQWILIRNLKANDIVVVDVTYPAADMVNATYSEKLSFGTKYAYIVETDGDVELDLRKTNAKEMNYFYGVYSYSPMSEEEIAAITAFQDAKAALETAITEAKAIETEGKEGVEALQTAIATAEGALAAEDATTESLTAAKTALDEAVAAFEKANKPATFDPATAIVNAEFNPEADPLGWEKVNSAQFYDLGMGLIGTYQVRGEHSASTVDETHLATEFAAGLECRWNTNYAAFTQTTAELPAGSYKLSFDVENTNATTTQANYENRFFVKVGETTYNDESTEWMNGKSAWTTHAITFTLTEASPITISLGYGTGSNNFGVGNTPALFVSHLMLDTCDPLVEAKAKAIAALETLAPIGEGLFFYNQTDIDNAKNAINAAETVEAVAAVAMPKATAPAADKAYAFQLRLDGETPLYMALAEGGITIAEEATALKFIAVEGTEGQYNLSNEDGTLFVGLAGGNAWTMSTLPDKMAAWTFTALPDGAYRINNLVTTGRFVGTNSAEKAAGSPCYADKQTSNGNVDWLIAEYVAPVKTDYTDYIVNADLKGEGGFDATGTKGIDGSGIVKVGNAAEFDFKQTISIPSGYYRLTAQAAYRYGGDETAEAAAITEGTATKLLKMYVKIGDKEFSVPVQNRYDGASETNLASEGAVLVNDKYVPNSSSAVQAWFAAGKYVNEVIFNLPADGDVTIGINRIATPESDYTVIGPWTLTRLGDAEVEPEPEPIEGIIYSWESPEGTPIEFGGTIAYVNGDGDRLNYAQGGYHTICLNGKKANIDDETASANAGKMVITLDKAVAEGDTIAYTAFINKNETKEASPYIVFENGTTAEGEIFGDEANIDATFNGVPTLKYTIVPAEAAGSKTITLTRSKTGTNLFITKLQIIEKKAEPEPEPTFFEFNGVAYIIDAETGKFVAAGHDYGTRGIISEIGLDLTFTANAETKMVTIDTKVKNTDTDHFLGSNLYMDAPAAEWGLLEQEFGFYITDGTKYLSIDANDNLALSEEPRLWILVTPEGVKDQILDDMKEASVEEPMDVTALIKANNFNRNDQRNAEAWTVSADCTNKNLSGGNGVNNCVESFHSTFTISQAIEGAPKGVYALTAQGFYRQDGSDNDHLPVFFANEETKTFPVKSGSENSMSDASGSFTNGLYTIDPIFVQVAEAGTLTVGAKLEGNTALWCIWDNFQLTYYGADADIDAVKNAAIIKELADLRAKALGLKEQIDVEAVKNAIDEAITTTADVTGAEAINTAIATVKAVIEKAEFYLTAKTALASMENVMAGTNVYTAEAFQTYNGIYEAAKGKYEAGELTAEDKLENPESLLGWHVANNVDDLLLSAWTIGETQCKDYDAGMYINTWSVEGENDGSNFKVPFFEYWTADANSLAENTLTATMTNLPEGKYDVTAWVRVRAKNGYTAPAYGITLSANEGEAVDVAAGDQVGTSQMYLKEFTAIGEVAADGVLKIQFKVAADNNISWLSFKNVKFVKQDVINDDDPEIEVAEGWRSIISNGNLASDEVANFFIKENAGDPVPAVIVPGAGKNNSRGIVINTPDNPSADWDAQFFIQANENIPAGYKIHVEFDYKASQEAAFDTQSHAEPGNYIHWYCVDSYTATTEWQHMSKEVEVSAATQDGNGNWNGEWGKACDASEGGKPFKTIAFNLSKVKTATTFYFDNIAFWVSEVATGIETVKNAKKADAIYNLSGQKVTKADKGLFIINGKKVVK